MVTELQHLKPVVLQVFSSKSTDLAGSEASSFAENSKKEVAGRVHATSQSKNTKWLGSSPARTASPVFDLSNLTDQCFSRFPNRKITQPAPGTADSCMVGDASPGTMDESSRIVRPWVQQNLEMATTPSKQSESSAYAAVLHLQHQQLKTILGADVLVQTPDELGGEGNPCEQESIIESKHSCSIFRQDDEEHRLAGSHKYQPEASGGRGCQESKASVPDTPKNGGKRPWRTAASNDDTINQGSGSYQFMGGPAQGSLQPQFLNKKGCHGKEETIPQGCQRGTDQHRPTQQQSINNQGRCRLDVQNRPQVVGHGMTQVLKPTREGDLADVQESHPQKTANIERPQDVLDLFQGVLRSEKRKFPEARVEKRERHQVEFTCAESQISEGPPPARKRRLVYPVQRRR